MQKHTTGGIPRWSPTLVLVARFSAYVWQSGRDAQFSLTCGRMCQLHVDTVYNPFIFDEHVQMKRKHKCQRCGSTYSRRDTLRAHLEQCTGMASRIAKN